MVYTDGATAYQGLPRQHESVEHSTGEYVRGDADTNRIESVWTGTKRSYMGTYHQWSRKHLPLYAAEVERTHNLRSLDTEDQMAAMVKEMNGKVGYRNLVAGAT